MKVSIVIPVYNVEKYLPCCLDSVLAQEYTDYEAILVDDGSTDNSPAICDEYAVKDGKFRVIHQENGGLSHARNTGVKASDGDYIFFLDSDDCIHPKAISTMVSLAQKNDAALIQMNIESVPENFNDYTRDAKGDYKVFHFDTVDGLYNIDRDNKQIVEDIRLITLVVWTKLYRRDLFETLSFPEDIKLHEDQMVAHRFIVQAKGIVLCRAALYFYRSRPNSLITEGWTVKRLTIFDCYKDRVEWVGKVAKESERGQELLYYIYTRYLVCMFKNYWMTTRKLQGAEKKYYKKQINSRFKKELKENPLPLKLKEKVVFEAFGVAPDGFTFIYDTTQRLKSLIAGKRK